MSSAAADFGAAGHATPFPYSAARRERAPMPFFAAGGGVGAASPTHPRCTIVGAIINRPLVCGFNCRGGLWPSDALFLPLARRDAAERGAGLSLMPRRAVTFACAKVTKTPAWGYRPLRTPFSCAVRIVVPIKIYSPLSRLSGEVELPVPDCDAYRSCWRLARP